MKHVTTQAAALPKRKETHPRRVAKKPTAAQDAYLRTPKQVFDEDFCWPVSILNRRWQAIAEVLCRIPEDDYDKLVKMIDSFTWFIPHEDARSMVYPFFVTVFPETKEGEMRVAPYAQVIYLSPTLETRRIAWAVVVAVVAHELAHLVLGHTVTGCSEERYVRQEEEVFDRLCVWGFRREVRAHEADKKRRGFV
jgi:hypothetical protein